MKCYQISKLLDKKRVQIWELSLQIDDSRHCMRKSMQGKLRKFSWSAPRDRTKSGWICLRMRRIAVPNSSLGSLIVCWSSKISSKNVPWYDDCALLLNDDVSAFASLIFTLIWWTISAFSLVERLVDCFMFSTSSCSSLTKLLQSGIVKSIAFFDLAASLSSNETWLVIRTSGLGGDFELEQVETMFL